MKNALSVLIIGLLGILCVFSVAGYLKGVDACEIAQINKTLIEAHSLSSPKQTQKIEETRRDLDVYRGITDTRLKNIEDGIEKLNKKYEESQVKILEAIKELKK